MLDTLIVKIKRRENKFYSILYILIKSILRFEVPVIKPLHLTLYYIRYYFLYGFSYLIEKLWHTPLFKARCMQVGRNLSLTGGMPYLIGDPKIYLGNNVTLMRINVGSSKVARNPIFKVGDHTSIGFGTTVSVCDNISIGDNCMIGRNCLLMDSDDHPVDPEKRKARLPVAISDVKPVKIGDNVWVGAYCSILKGVTIGDNSIIGTYSVVTRDIPANCIAVGQPAKPVTFDIGEQ